MDLLSWLMGIIGIINTILLVYLLFRRSNVDYSIPKLDLISTNISRIESNLKEDFRVNREENSAMARDNRSEMSNSFKDFKVGMSETLRLITEQNQKALETINTTLDDSNKLNRETLTASLREFIVEQRVKFDELKVEQKDLTAKTVDQLEKLITRAKEDNKFMRESMEKAFREFQQAFDKNVASFNDLQREKFGQLEDKQMRLVEGTEKKLEEMRVMVDEKLQKTLNERIGQSFEMVSKQLESVQTGLGEMKTLAQDVGGLKRVLSNVKMRGGIGEVQLSLLLEQILAPDQYEANVKTKIGSSDLVEFAIKLPGHDSSNSSVWLPVDAKFPRDIYEHLQDAYDTVDALKIENAQKVLYATIRKMARDISDKYIDPPNTTDFAIMFLPFEGIYAEVVRKASLLEELQRDFKIVITGPTTLAAILNSLQMGFRTLAIQKRSGEVWKILGAVKNEFENFGGMLEKAQKNLHTASNQIDEVMGKRTRAIQRKLKSVETLDSSQASLLLHGEVFEEENGEEEKCEL